MLVVAVYDIRTDVSGGAKRLRKTSKIFLKYGIRVQNSVFECVLNENQFQHMKDQVNQILDKENDSVRFYRMGNHFDGKVETIGKGQNYLWNESNFIF